MIWGNGQTNFWKVLIVRESNNDKDKKLNIGGKAYEKGDIPRWCTSE